MVLLSITKRKLDKSCSALYGERCLHITVHLRICNLRELEQVKYCYPEYISYFKGVKNLKRKAMN